MGQPLGETVWDFFKLNTWLPPDPGMTLLYIHLRYKFVFMQETCVLMLIAAVFVIAPNWNQPRRLSLDEG